MTLRILVFVSLISFSIALHASSTIVTSEPVPGWNCKCMSNDNCINIPTRKYECIVSTNIADKTFSVNLSSLDPIGQKGNVTNTTISQIPNSNREIANFINIIIYWWILLYFLPIVIVIFSKNRAHRLATILINIFLWWSIIGWFVALFLSIQSNLVRVELVDKNIDNTGKIW